MIRLYNPGNERECIQKGNLLYQCEQEDIWEGRESSGFPGEGFEAEMRTLPLVFNGKAEWPWVERIVWGKTPGEAATRTGDSDVPERHCVGNPVEGCTTLTISQTSPQEELLHIRSTVVPLSSFPMRQCAGAEALPWESRQVSYNSFPLTY